MANATDPVCGMTVDTNSASRSTYAGQTYYFCSAACKNEFEEEPSRFASKRRPATDSDASLPDAS